MTRHVHVYQKGVAVFGVWSIFAFIIKRILGIKRIFPCSFGNKRMRLLTRVYGMSVNSLCSTHQFSEPWNWSNHSEVILIV